MGYGLTCRTKSSYLGYGLDARKSEDDGCFCNKLLRIGEDGVYTGGLAFLTHLDEFQRRHFSLFFFLFNFT